jgi:hypothetical protein
MSKVNHRACARCGFPVKANSDHLTACRYAESVSYHWPCWIALLAEHDQLTVAELTKAANAAEV